MGVDNAKVPGRVGECRWGRKWEGEEGTLGKEREKVRGRLRSGYEWVSRGVAETK